MNPNGMKVFNKTALTLVVWMTGIVLVVAWRSEGNTFAICLASGLPLGVLALWVIVHLSEASRLTPQQMARLPKKTTARKAPVVQTIARMPLHTIANATNVNASTALRAAAAAASRTNVNRPKPVESPVETLVPEPTPDFSLAGTDESFPKEETTTIAHSSTFHPLDSISTNAAKQMMANPNESGVFAAAEESSFNVNFLDHMTYLYKPGQERDRQTLDLELKQKHKQTASSTGEKEKSIPQLDIDWLEN